MSKNAGITKDVQALVQRAKAQRWKVVATTNARLLFTPPSADGQPVVVSQRAAGRTLANIKAALKRSGLTLEDPPKKTIKAKSNLPTKESAMPRVAETARISVGGAAVDPSKKTHADYTVPEQALLVWEYAVAQCLNRKASVKQWEGADYYHWTHSSMADLIGGIFPEITDYEGGTRYIYDYLRSTGNALNLTPKVGPASRQWSWLIRVEWDATPPRASSLPDAIAEAEAKRREAERKITPEEANEDGSRNGPVQVKRPGKTEDDDKPKPYRDSNGVWHCPVEGCGHVNTRQEGMAGHMAKHGKPRVHKPTCPECRAAGIRFTAKTPAGLGSHRARKHGVQGSSVASAAYQAAKAVVVNPPQIIVLPENQETPVTPDLIDSLVQNAVATFEAQVRAKLTEESESIEQIRERAQRAESRLKEVRGAIETLPLAQAYARIVEIIS